MRKLKDCHKMLPSIYKLLFVIIMLSDNGICKILRQRLYSNDSISFKRRDDLNAEEYVPLNSVTLNLLYNNIGKPYAVDPTKNNHWFNVKKNGIKPNINLDTMTDEPAYITTTPSNGVYQNATNKYLPTSQVLDMVKSIRMSK